jgi:hypothetical protein
MSSYPWVERCYSSGYLGVKAEGDNASCDHHTVPVAHSPYFYPITFRRAGQ